VKKGALFTKREEGNAPKHNYFKMRGGWFWVGGLGGGGGGVFWGGGGWGGGVNSTRKKKRTGDEEKMEGGGGNARKGKGGRGGVLFLFSRNAEETSIKPDLLGRWKKKGGSVREKDENPCSKGEEKKKFNFTRMAKGKGHPGEKKRIMICIAPRNGKGAAQKNVEEVMHNGEKETSKGLTFTGEKGTSCKDWVNTR